MLVIRRVKNKATHYAAAVQPRGNVSRWVDDRAKAALVPEELAGKCAEYHTGRVNCGRVVLETEAGKVVRTVAETLPPPPPPPPGEPAAKSPAADTTTHP